MTHNRQPAPFPTVHPDRFESRHLGPNTAETESMLRTLGIPSLDELAQQVIPAPIRLDRPLVEPDAVSEQEALAELAAMAGRNRIQKSYIGLGYHPSILPPVIQRNILENPGWYTQYTPYQAEISQGRLQAMLNFQTMVADLTGLPVANASLLDEATAAAEAMAMARALTEDSLPQAGYFISDRCHPQTISVVRTRAEALGITVHVGSHDALPAGNSFFGALLQYPTSDGSIIDYTDWIASFKTSGALVTVAADIMALLLLKTPGDMGADIAVGSTQRFGLPMGCGGPHAAFFATRDEFKRSIPGRLVGVSRDASGRPALRLSLQTREQHIRREKATSNICTAQVLPAVIASMYAVYHGPDRLRAIAARIHRHAALFATGAARLGLNVSESYFDTVKVTLKENASTLLDRAHRAGINLRRLDDRHITVSLNETTGPADVEELLTLLAGGSLPFAFNDLFALVPQHPPQPARQSPFLTHPVFNQYHSETEMLRYMRMLESRDLSLAHSMIPLGSCTMKLNATSEMMPVTWPGFAHIHPFAPSDQMDGYRQLAADLETWLSKVTGFPGISLQPNAGSQGEYAGLLVVRRYHESRGEPGRNICLIPSSAHGTNPASAVMAGFRVVVVKCDPQGNVDLADLKAKAAEHAPQLAACMVTYPSTHGVFEETIREICDIVHAHGGQVYMDGANMNAQVGLCSPGDIGIDLCHLNLHKTFCIPHGGGGPGMGPIGVAAHLKPFLPRHPLDPHSSQGPVGPVSAAPLGSGLILTISWAYIRMMGGPGLRRASLLAILNANYIARRLDPYFPVLYKSPAGLVAHECILDLRGYKAAGVEVEDVAKRLMDYGFHAPTMSWPVAGTLMVEPTESESKAELDRFCDAMIRIHAEITDVKEGRMAAARSPLKFAPHTARDLAADTWDRDYTRQTAAFPAPWLHDHKFWPHVNRVDNVYGDRNLFCTCAPVEEHA
jgi:glycine dehydrogenase